MSGGDGRRTDANAGGSAHLSGTRTFAYHYFRRRRGSFVALVGIVLSAAACAVAVQYGMKLLVDAMAAGEAAAEGVWTALGLFLTLIGVENVLWRTAGWLGCRTLVGTGVDIRGDLFDHLSGHSMAYFSEHLSGSLGHRITATAGAFGALASTLLWSVVPPCVDFFGALVIFGRVHPAMAGALAGFVLFVAGGLAWFGARGRPLHDAYAERSNAVSGELVDVVGNMWAVKAFSARRRELERLRSSFGEEARAQRRSWMWLEKTRTAHDVGLTLMAGVILAWAIDLWTRGTITPGDVVVVSALTFRILHGSRDLVLALVGTSQHWHFIGETLRTVGRSHAILDAPSARRPARSQGSVSFDRVSFAYGAGRPVLRGFQLEIPAGQHVGLVGASGAGKSTVLALLQRLHDPTEGEIRLDGQRIGGLAQDELRRQLAVVPQEISLFHRSVMENLRYGRPEATDDEVRAAARAARCDGFIRALPDSYDTRVGERGLKLSGGQRQRIGIARALLKNAPILLLDEATSALDTESEREVQVALDALVAGRTVIAVAHRLSTLLHLHRVIVLHEGRIVEDGDPSELRTGDGIFGRLWRLQAEGLSVEQAAAEAVAGMKGGRRSWSRVG